MVDTDGAATLTILTFRVGPYLLGAEAEQIAQLPRPANQNQTVNENGDFDDIRTLDLRSICDLQPAPNEQQSQLLMVDRAGEMVGYKVDQIGDLITVEVANHVWPLPPLLLVQKRWQQLWGVCQWEGELVLLVDLQYEPQNTAKEE